MVEQTEELLKLISFSKNIIALTGAGISTDSGIPDYRSPETGLWTKIDQSVVSLEGFYKNPENYYSYALDLYPVRKKAKPNAAHELLSKLERDGVLTAIITQNVDGLHQQAGSRVVYELHGSTRRVVCLSCAQVFSMEYAMQKVFSGENPPLCGCGGVLKPDAVFFGEPLPEKTWEDAKELVIRSDLLLVMGTSLQVSPVNSLPSLALNSGSTLVIINLAVTPFDGQAKLVINENIGEFSLCFNEIYNKNPDNIQKTST